MNSMIRTAPAYQAPLRFVVVAGAHVLAAFVIAGALNLPAVVEVFNSQLVQVPVTPDRTTQVQPPRPNDGEALQDKLIVEATVVPPLATDSSDPEFVTPQDPVDTGGSGSAVVPLHRIDVRADPAHPLTQPDYPAASVRGSEEGVVVLELSVGSDGRVFEARVVQSSGYPRLDAAAVREALRRWRMLPATENGQAVAARIRERVVFRLQDAY